MAIESNRPIPSVYEKISGFQSPLRASREEERQILAKPPLEKGKMRRDLLKAFGRETVELIALTPLHRVRSLLRCQNEMLKTGRLSEPYKGPFDCVARTVRSEGLISLWRGNVTYIASNFVSMFTGQGLRLYFAIAMSAFSHPESKEDCYLFARKVAAFSAASVCVNLFVYPLDYGYTRLSTDIKTVSTGSLPAGLPRFTLDSAKRCSGTRDHRSGERQFKGLFDVYKKTIKSDGIGGIYRGFFVTCAGDILLVGLDLARTNLVIKPMLRNDKEKRGMNRNRDFGVAMLDMGMLCFLSAVLYPFETIRGRMMMRSGEGLKYKGGWAAFRHIVKKEGPKSLFKGFSMNVLMFPCVLVFGRLLTIMDQNK